VQKTFRSEYDFQKSPRAAEPNRTTDSRFVFAAPRSRFTNSASLESIDDIRSRPSPASRRAAAATAAAAKSAKASAAGISSGPAAKSATAA
jgi:hypothetical protein